MTPVIHEEPTKFLLFESISGLIGGLLNLFTVYLIVCASPKYMGQYKYYVLWYQVWSVSCELFYHGCLIEIYFPSPSFKAYGIFYTNGLYEFSASLLFKIGFLIVANMIVSTFQCCLYRHQLLLPDGHWFKLPTWAWTLIIGFHYVTIVTSVLVCIDSFPIQHSANATGLRKLLEEYPEYAFVADDPMIWIADTSFLIAPPLLNFTGITGLCIISFFFAPEVGIVVFLAIGHSFYLLDGNGIVMSAKTRSLHKKLCISLLVQMGLPFILLIFPLLLYVYILSTNTMIAQEWINASMCLVYAHATISSALICTCTEPYRMFLRTSMSKIIRTYFRKSQISNQQSTRRTVTQSIGLK